MPSMRCKVRLHSLTTAANNGVAVKFYPVVDGCEENKRFHAAIPSGEFTATLSKEAAETIGAFKLGEEYFVDFRTVPLSYIVTQAEK